MSTTTSEIERIAESLMPYVKDVSIIHCFLRSMPSKTFRITKRIDEKDTQPNHYLEAQDFNFLGLIQQLTLTSTETYRSKPVTTTADLRQAFGWYMSVEKHKTDADYVTSLDSKFDYYLKKLKETGLINNPKKGYYSVTPKGDKELLELAKIRCAFLGKLVGPSKFSESEIHSFFAKLTTVSDALWTEIMDASEDSFS